MLVLAAPRSRTSERESQIWKILLDKSNLGNKELELAELTLKAGTTVTSHTHQSLEVTYVLSGTLGPKRIIDYATGTTIKATPESERLQ